MKAHLLEEFCSLSQDERIADSMKPIFPNLPLLCHLRVERVGVDVRRYGPRIKRGIEVRDVDDIG